MAAKAACDWPSAIRHSRSVRGSTTTHHAIRDGHREARGWRRAYFSQPIFGADRSLCSPHIRRGMLNVGTIGDFSRKVARPAGFEPATPGLEGRAFRSGGTTRYNAVQSGTAGRFFGRFSGRFQVDPGGGRAAVPDRRAQGRTGGKTDGPRPRRARAAAAHGPWRGPHPPPAAVDIRPIRRSARTRSIVSHRSPRLPVAPAHSASLSRPPERGWTDGRPSAAATQEGPIP